MKVDVDVDVVDPSDHSFGDGFGWLQQHELLQTIAEWNGKTHSVIDIPCKHEIGCKNL